MFNKHQRFSIRKLSLGVASVLLGAISISAMEPVSAQDVPAEGVVEYSHSSITIYLRRKP